MSDKKKKKSHLEKTLEKNSKRDYIMKRNLHAFYYWTNILIILLLNFAGIFILSPILLFMGQFWALFFTAVFALSLGMMLNYLALSMSHLELRHHLISILIIPFLVIADFFVFNNFIEFLIRIFQVNLVINNFYLAIVFAGCILLPYSLSLKLKGWWQ